MNGTAKWLAVAVSLIGGFEGIRQTAYLDPVGIPTICFGETIGVKMGDYKSRAQCDGLLIRRIFEFEEAVRRCVTVPISDPQRVAFVSLAYNIGSAQFCRSTVVKRTNAGERAGGCEAIMMWDKARIGGTLVTLPGLAKRRATERDLCLQEAL